MKNQHIIDLNDEDYHSLTDMNASPAIRIRNPAHPGSFVKHEIIAPLGLSVTRAAQILGVTRAALSALLNARAQLSPEMALRLEKAFGVSMDTLMRMQNSHDIAKIRQRAQDIQVSPFMASTPLPTSSVRQAQAA